MFNRWPFLYIPTIFLLVLSFFLINQNSLPRKLHVIFTRLDQLFAYAYWLWVFWWVVVVVVVVVSSITTYRLHIYSNVVNRSSSPNKPRTVRVRERRVG